MELHLKDKVAVITGGSMGIGLATAQALAKEQVHIVLCARDGTNANQEAERLKSRFGVQALGLSCDVTSVEEISFMVDTVKNTFGGIDILFNNAGAGTNETILDAPDS